MARFWKMFFVLLLLTASVSASASRVVVDSLRIWTAPDHTRMVFDVSKPPAHRIFSLQNPARLVIDIRHATVKKPLRQPPNNHPLFSHVRSGVRNRSDLRIVLDLKTPVDSKSFALRPSHDKGNRLVVDLIPKAETKKYASAKPVKAKRKIKHRVTKSVFRKPRDIIIAVDAGHGGEDPGARGPRGTNEKNVVFAIARQLVKLIDQQPGMKAVMVRKGDYYIELRQRIKIARKAKADLFVSIHADAFKHGSARGASVFTLSRTGASSEAARWLANHENAVDQQLAGGVNLLDKDETLASVLLDMSQAATKEASRQVGVKVLENFGNIGNLHKSAVQKANFVVLKSPDIPSILVETAFISNPAEERKLRSRAHQKKMASAIFNGIRAYFIENAPSNTLFANAPNGQAKHVISRGETLSEIAELYGVSIKAIKSANEMTGSVVRIGQVLKIPLES